MWHIMVCFTKSKPKKQFSGTTKRIHTSFRGLQICTEVSHSTKNVKTVASFLHAVEHETIKRTGITCKKIPCYMRDSTCRWFIVKKLKYSEVMLKIFEFSRM